ncbi:SPJ_0845 family protein [Enterococcus timonensis]|nr:SPJ_0845 family protein [Enterococcus timonensis]
MAVKFERENNLDRMFEEFARVDAVPEKKEDEALKKAMEKFDEKQKQEQK